MDISHVEEIHQVMLPSHIRQAHPGEVIVLLAYALGLMSTLFDKSSCHHHVDFLLAGCEIANTTRNKLGFSLILLG